MDILNKKLEKGIPVLGTHISLNDSVITELIGNIGFDYLWIDTEHSAIDLYCLQQHLIAARAAGVSAIVRIPWNDPVRAKPVLEMGPEGIVFPMVKSYEEAVKAVKACIYPPEGIRGIGPRRAIQFGNIDIKDYFSHVDNHLLKIIQIEHIDAVRDLNHILSINEIDAFVIGPADLAASIGKIGKIEDSEVMETIKLIINKVKGKNKPVGVSYGGSFSYESIMKWEKLGVNMISLSADTDLLLQGAKSLLNQMREIFISE